MDLQGERGQIQNSEIRWKGLKGRRHYRMKPTFGLDEVQEDKDEFKE